MLGARTAWRQGIAPLAILVWLIGTIAGFGALYHYSFTPGTAGQAPSTWLNASGIEFGPDLPMLLIFVHPQCPCSRATIGELEQLMTRCLGRADVHVCFFRPSGVEESWEQTELWVAASRIPGVRVSADPEGHQANRFAVKTSGHTLLYGTRGQLLFSGGITGSRGHAGDNPGRSAVIDLLEGRRPTTTTMPVFGCALATESSDLP